MSSTDSDTFSYRKGNMIIQCRGPNLNRVARGDSASFQRIQHFTVPSRTYRSKTSPMSMQCFPNHGRPISRSRRLISPFTVNTFGFNRTMSALDIVKAIKDKQCPGKDVSLILNACRDRLKIDKRKIMQKRGNIYLRRRIYSADDDSGDQESVSSLSSSESRAPSHSISGRTKNSYLKEISGDSTLYNDCTENLTGKNLRKLGNESCFDPNNDKCIQKSVISGYNEKNDFLCDKFTNAMNMIHKIVPPDHINNIVSTNKSVALSKKIKQKNGSLKKPTEVESEKWNVDSTISVHNDGGISDTYTDEEIPVATKKTTISKTAKKKSRQSQKKR